MDISNISLKYVPTNKVPSILFPILPLGLEDMEVYRIRGDFPDFFYFVKGTLATNENVDYFLGMYTSVNGNYELSADAIAAPDCQDPILKKSVDDQAKELLNQVKEE